MPTKHKFKAGDLVYDKNYSHDISVVLGYDHVGYLELETLEGFDYLSIATNGRNYRLVTPKVAKRILAAEEECAKEEYKRALKTLAKTRKRVAKYLANR